MKLAPALAALLSMAALYAFPSAPQAAARDTRLAALLSGHPGAATLGVAVIEEGRLAWSGVYGRQDQNRLADANTLFNVASLAKPVTAELVLRLASARRLDLDEAMSGWWVDPDLVGDPRLPALTARVALSHRTGFPNWRRMATGGRLAFATEPGRAYGYSGEGFEYLARYAERRAGGVFEELVQRDVFDPLGMTRTSYSRRPWMSGSVAAPFESGGDFGRAALAEQGDWIASDNLFTTVADYGRFVAAVSRNDGVSTAMADDRLTSLSEIEGCSASTAGCPDAVGFGLGWMTFRFGDQVFALHEGSDSGETAMAYFDPRTRRGVVVLVNGAGQRNLILDVLDVVDPGSPVARVFRTAAQAR